MVLVQCNQCMREVSSRTLVCPHCGAPARSMTSPSLKSPASSTPKEAVNADPDQPPQPIPIPAILGLLLGTIGFGVVGYWQIGHGEIVLGVFCWLVALTLFLAFRPAARDFIEYQEWIAAEARREELADSTARARGAELDKREQVARERAVAEQRLLAMEQETLRALQEKEREVYGRGRPE